MKKIHLDIKWKPLMEAWIEDLKENLGYEGNHYLYDSSQDTYCPLGRLCIVAGADKEDIRYKEMIYKGMAEVPEIFYTRTEDGRDIFIPFPDDVANLIVTMADTTTGISEELSKEWNVERKDSYGYNDIADFLTKHICYEKDDFHNNEEGD